MPVGPGAGDVFAVEIGDGYGQSTQFTAETGQIIIDQISPDRPKIEMHGRLIGVEFRPVTGEAALCRLVSMSFDVY